MFVLDQHVVAIKYTISACVICLLSVCKCINVIDIKIRVSHFWLGVTRRRLNVAFVRFVRTHARFTPILNAYYIVVI